MIKNYFKIPEMINPLAKRQFSHSNISQSPSFKDKLLKHLFDKGLEKINNDSPKRSVILKAIVDNIDAKRSIIYDLAKIEPAKRAVEKMSNNETPLKKEFTAHMDLKNQYQAHLGDNSDSDESSLFGEAPEELTEKTQLEKLNDLKEYLLDEKKSVINTLIKLRKQLSKLPLEVSVEEETTKRKFEESSDEESSKKNRIAVDEHLTPGDYIDTLFTEHNPFDDIGFD